MSVFDETEIIWGQAGIPGTGLTEGEKTNITTRLTNIEATGIPANSTDLGDFSTTAATSGQIPVSDGTKYVPTTPATTTITGSLPIVVDNGGSNISAGVKADIPLEFAGTIVGWRILNDPSGSITWHVWKDTYGNYPPTGSDLILTATATSVPSAQAPGALTLTFAAGDTLRIYVPAGATVTRSTFSLTITREI